jgi:hypothetical protein
MRSYSRATAPTTAGKTRTRHSIATKSSTSAEENNVNSGSHLLHFEVRLDRDALRQARCVREQRLGEVERRQLDVLHVL